VLREILLRAWHRKQFSVDVIENVGWQGELVQRLEEFIKPLIKDIAGIGRLNSWIPSRLDIIKHTIQLWSYLWSARMEAREIIHPTPGDLFDSKIHEIPLVAARNDEDVCWSSTIRVLWVLRRGFTYTEKRGDGSRRVITVKAMVLVK
jgi:hypothetical protein